MLADWETVSSPLSEWVARVAAEATAAGRTAPRSWFISSPTGNVYITFIEPEPAFTRQGDSLLLSELEYPVILQSLSDDGAPVGEPLCLGEGWLT